MDVNQCTYDFDSDFQNIDTPLIMTSKNGNEKIIKYLIKHGANINEYPGNYNSTPLGYACRQYGNENSCKIFS